MTGWVYAFETPSMPGFIKIGATRRSPAERLDEANASDTWRPPHPYVITCAVEVADPFAGERAVHALLAARRINPRNEFFDVTAEEARIVFSLLTPKAAHDRVRSESLPNLAPLVDSRAAAPGSYANRAVASQTPEGKLRAWVDENYTQVSTKEKDTGTKLEVLSRRTPRRHLRCTRGFLGRTCSPRCSSLSPRGSGRTGGAAARAESTSSDDTFLATFFFRFFF